MNIVIFLISLIVSIVVAVQFLSYLLYYHQLSGYNLRNTIVSVISRCDCSVILMYIVPFVISTILNIMIVGVVRDYFMIVECVGFLLINLALNNNFTQRKVKLNWTKRFIRLYVFSIVTSIALIFVCLYYVVYCSPKLLSLIYLVQIGCVLCVTISTCILYPIEKLINHIYLSSACKILSNHGGLTKIAITGSYGKTSTKYILNTILSEKYNVLMTPNSYNTPMGITKVIREMLVNNDDIFIMEFGAKKQHEIEYLCKLFKPNMGILVSIGNCHINTFKSIENVAKTKAELVSNLYGKDKYLSYCNDDVRVQNICKNVKYPKISAGLNDMADVYALNIVTSEQGTTFDVYYNNQYYLSASTCLLGKHNVSNILLCVALAIKLKLSKQQIINGIKKVKHIKGRLELIPHSSGATIINDGYNSNPQSARVAIDTLNLFKNKTKIIITPGMIELGKTQYEENYRLGKYIAKNCDKAIIVNEENKIALVKGLIDGGMEKANIKTYKTLNGAMQNKFDSSQVILLENDLPDNYE